MPTPDRIRNVVLLGHNGSGKTSLAEAMLFRAEVTNRPGTVDRGDTVMDHDPEERELGQSISLAVASLDWNGHRINLIDTPGYADFRGEAMLGLAAADLAVFVIDGVAGVQSQDVVLWRLAASMGMPRLLFINKLDRERSSFDRTLAQVREMFGSHADPTELPIGAESGFHGVADLLTHHAFVYDTGHAEEAAVPDELADAERVEHEHLVEDVIELDDTALEEYLSGNEPSADQLEQLLHEALDRALVFPVLCGSATTPIGVDQLADFICRVGPAPGDGGPTIVDTPAGTVEIAPDPAGPPMVLVFKTSLNEFLGQISVFKVISGTVRTDDILVNSRTGAKERLHNLISLTGGSQTHVDRVGAGDIAATTKLEDTCTGDTLAPDGTPVTVAAPELPGPSTGSRSPLPSSPTKTGWRPRCTVSSSRIRRSPWSTTRRRGRRCSEAPARPTCGWRCRVSSARASTSRWTTYGCRTGRRSPAASRSREGTRSRAAAMASSVSRRCVSSRFPRVPVSSSTAR